ncbi:MAG: tetratricopeptide repeat protein [Acidobacteria bacterium]|nr:tetratricopeptide repeat protein [Acidobacteriota bacterium]
MNTRFAVPWLAAGVLLAAAALPSAAQGPGTPQPKNPKAAAYYHAALGHLYSDLAAQYGGRGEYVGKAIENYKLAMRYDPEAASLSQELADLYIQSGQIRSAVNEFEEAVKRNPDDVNSRRILGRLYTARIREGQQNRMNEDMLKQAITQYEKVGEKSPTDIDNWLMLGRLYKLAQNSVASEKAYKKALELQSDNEEGLTGLAMVYSDLGDTAGASQMLKKVVDKNPSTRTLMALASAYEQLKEYRQAADAYKRALDLNKDNTDLKRAYAESLFKADDLAAAKPVFEELGMEDPTDLLSALRLSQIFRQQHDFAKAHEYARKASKLDPNNLEIQYNEVSLLEAEGKTNEAIAKLKEVLAGMDKRPSSTGERSNRVILLERLGILYRFSEQTQNAVATFQEIADLDPEAAPRAMAQAIDALRAGKDFAAAEKLTKSSLQKYPQDRILKSVAATVYTDLSHFKEAETILKTMFDGKSDRETWIALAQVYEKQKNHAEMAKAIDKAGELSKTPEETETIHFMRGAMYERQKKFDLAENEFKQVLKLNPESASALNYLGYMLADRNVRLPEALEMVRKAVDLEPNNGAFLDSLGWVYFRMNRMDEAVEQLKRSLERSSRDPTVHEHLGDVYQGMDNLKDAITQWERSLTEWQSNAPSDIDQAEIAKIQKKVEGAKVRLAREPAAKKN